MRTDNGLIQSPAFSRPAAIMAAVVDPRVDPNDRDACLNRIGTQIRSAGATILSGAGHGMMAGFGVGSLQDGAQEGIRAGHLILQNFAVVAARWRQELSIETGVGIGLHLGEVALGTLGPPGHKRTTLVGDTVNVAARLCGRARAGELLLSCSVATALDAVRALNGHLPMPVAFLQLPQFELRGRTAPLDIWCVPAPERVTF